MDDADLLTDCDVSGELSKIITRGAGRSLALVLAGNPDILAGGFVGRRPAGSARLPYRPSDLARR
jgi:hypothetical protein